MTLTTAYIITVGAACLVIGALSWALRDERKDKADFIKLSSGLVDRLDSKPPLRQAIDDRINALRYLVTLLDLQSADAPTGQREAAWSALRAVDPKFASWAERDWDAALRSVLDGD